ncbi:MAG: DNA polymerase III subunit alpha [Planctomycetaceae bacterium]|jgi:DNA polymerase-3 subunit alpha|nr:DNA polymerase III subunit alpha [Planctomycetaceae bacterium]
MEVPFVHLHCHSHYSLLDGAGKIKDLVKRAKDLGMTALALTDHGNLYGALEFYKEAKSQGIKPIIGYEAYIAHGSRTEKVADSKKKAYSHLTLLAINHTGYKNLLKLASIAHLEGFYYKPRIDKEILEKYNEGLICLSGCASSEIARLLIDSEFDKAKEVAKWYRSIFDDRYYLEIQDHGLSIQKTILEGIPKISEELKIPMVATNDVHYIYERDGEAQKMLLCVSRDEPYDDSKQKEVDEGKYFLRSGNEMRQAMPGHEDAIARSVEIADRIDIDLELGRLCFPVFTPPNNLSTIEYLRQLCLDGLKKRYADQPNRCKDGQLSEEVLARLDRELSVIEKLGFPDYFLIVWDLVRVAEERGIHRTARGSGVGALVCYALYMSHVCPLEYGLLFERFLDESRREAPDIDIDFDQDRRGEILEYITEKYGKENVARLGTFNTLLAKGAINDVGRALGMPISKVRDVTKLIPPDPEAGVKMTIDRALKETEELSKLYEDKYDTQIKNLLDFAQNIEGLARNTGVHACGVVIANKPLIEYVPLQLDRKREVVITQWEGKSVEMAGLLKMDILGLQNLTILAHSIDLVKQSTGTTIDPYRLQRDDKETFELFCRGETKGIFQFESGGMRGYLQRLQPDCFRDIIAMAAMYRPGPLKGGMVDNYIDIKHGKAKPKYAHPVLKEVLAETNGVMVYQEQIMKILNQLGNIPLGDAYSCIKAISKKKDFSKFREKFVAGSKENGLQEDKANGIFDLIVAFAGYGFNKSHSTAYALIAYITAYLKVHYPIEFMAALLCADISNRNFSQKDSTVIHYEDCVRMGIEILPPDVNTSKRLYSIEDGKIVFALTAIKSCGDWAADKIVQARETGGPFKSLFDFCERVDNRACNRAAIEALIKAGAFDSMGCKRAQLFQIIDSAMKAGQGAAEDAARGQGNLFGGGDDESEKTQPPALQGLPEIREWSDNEKAIYEKEVLGFYLSTHPLQAFLDIFAKLRTHECEEVLTLPEKTPVVLAGMVSDIKIATGKDNRKYANFTLEDASGSVRSIMWADTYEQFAHLIKSDSIVCMRGKMNRGKSQSDSSDDGNFVPDEAWAIDIGITLDEQRHNEDSVNTLVKILQENPGHGAVDVSLRLKDGSMATFSDCRMTTRVTPTLQQQIAEFLGADSAKIGEKVAKWSKKAPSPPTYSRYSGRK